MFARNIIEVTDDDYEVSEEEKDILKKQFRAADFDNNKLLSESEITMAISRETKQHIMVRIMINTAIQISSSLQQAMRNNFRVFFSLDKINKNGQVR